MTKVENFLNKRLSEITKQHIRNSKGLGLHIKYILHQNKDNTSTIYSRLTYKGKISEISSGIRCQKYQFKRKPILHVDGDDIKTQFLQIHDRAIQQAFANLKLSGKDFDVSDIRCQVIGITNQNENPTILSALEIFLKHLTVNHESNNYAHGTLKKYKMWHNRMHEFLLDRYGRKGKLDKIIPYDIQAFVMWLKTVRKYKNNPAQYIAIHLNRFMEFCIGNGWITNNPFITFKKKFDEEQVIYLTEEEINRLEQTKIVSKGLESVRDTFLFMYELGMNYADISAHQKEHLIKSDNGKQYIIKQRTKTRIPQVIPLSERAISLIQKYENHSYCIERKQFVPVFKSEVMNRYLKQIAEICNIEKHLSTKRARTSKITNLYAAGENQERIQMIAGHRIGSSITHRHYINHDTDVLITRLESLAN